MNISLTVDQLANAALNACSSYNRPLTEAWTKHFRAEARIEGGYLHYLATRTKLDEITNIAAIGDILKSKGAILIEGVLAYHLETAVPHIAAYALDEFMQRISFDLHNPFTYRVYPNNEFLNPMKLTSTGPLINAQIEYDERVIWSHHMLWLKETNLAEMYQASLVGETLDKVYTHPFLPGDLKIEAISGSESSTNVHPALAVRPMSTLRIYRTGRDGMLLSPNEAAGL